MAQKIERARDIEKSRFGGREELKKNQCAYCKEIGY